MHWKRSQLDDAGTWKRVAIDFMYYKGQLYLTFDCGPCRFSIWRQVKTLGSKSMTSVLEQLFFERCSPSEILTNNDTAFAVKFSFSFCVAGV